MGYETEFSLSILVDPHKDLIDEEYIGWQVVMQRLIENEAHMKLGYEVDYYEDLFTEDYVSAKWGSHEDDMRVISSLFPGVLFLLTGEGEEWGDRWKKYFLNGKMHRVDARISIEYDEFDPAKLQ